MTVHQCPKCVLRFERKTELDYHCREDHPDFRHEYPVRHPHPVPNEAANTESQPSGTRSASSVGPDRPSTVG